MKKAILIATALVAGFGSSQVEAQALKGSDTLEAVTNSVLSQCPAATGVSYLGTGTGNGENAMVAGTQQIAPMSRKVKCSISSTNPSSQGKVLGYDGLSIVRSQCTFVNGDCQSYTSIPGYTFQAGTDNGAYTVACDKLRVLYFGRDHNNVTDCNSATRQALVNSWDNVFEGAVSEASCTQLRHAFRRDDASGTTDTLKGVCALPSAAVFCNGTTGQDNDPIRRPATPANYDIAAADGTLGVVLPISVPSTATNIYSPGTPSTNSCGAFAAGTTRCSSGVFRFRSYPGFGRCPGNTPRRGNLCRIPVVSAGSDPRCINSSANIPGGSATFDGRVYNNIPRNLDGTAVAGVVSPYYRMHETRGFFGNGCKQLDSTQQIGCLAAANGCAEGYAGREAELEPGARGVKLASAAGVCTDATPAAILSGTYPISRKLYLGTLKGFANVTGSEAALSACFSNEALVEGAITANGYIADPASGIQTESFSAPNCF